MMILLSIGAKSEDVLNCSELLCVEIWVCMDVLWSLLACRQSVVFNNACQWLGMVC
ncbi:unnamed protein product [Camellia sinensis]